MEDTPPNPSPEQEPGVLYQLKTTTLVAPSLATSTLQQTGALGQESSIHGEVVHADNLLSDSPQHLSLDLAEGDHHQPILLRGSTDSSGSNTEPTPTVEVFADETLPNDARELSGSRHESGSAATASPSSRGTKSSVIADMSSTKHDEHYPSHVSKSEDIDTAVNTADETTFVPEETSRVVRDDEWPYGDTSTAIPGKVAVRGFQEMGEKEEKEAFRLHIDLKQAMELPAQEAAIAGMIKAVDKARPELDQRRKSVEAAAEVEQDQPKESPKDDEARAEECVDSANQYKASTTLGNTREGEAPFPATLNSSGGFGCLAKEYTGSRGSCHDFEFQEPFVKDTLRFNAGNSGSDQEGAGLFSGLEQEAGSLSGELLGRGKPPERDKSCILSEDVILRASEPHPRSSRKPVSNSPPPRRSDDDPTVSETQTPVRDRTIRLLRWFQGHDFVAKEIDRDFKLHFKVANGHLVGACLAYYYPQRLKEADFYKGSGPLSKAANWDFLQNFLAKRGFSFRRQDVKTLCTIAPISSEEGTAAANRILLRLYSFLLADDLVPPLRGVQPAPLRPFPSRQSVAIYRRFADHRTRNQDGGREDHHGDDNGRQRQFHEKNASSRRRPKDGRVTLINAEAFHRSRRRQHNKDAFVLEQRDRTRYRMDRVMFEPNGQIRGGARHRPFNSPRLISRETKLSLVGGDAERALPGGRKEGVHDSGVVGRGDERVVLGEGSDSRRFGSSSRAGVCERGHGDVDQRRRNKMNVDGRSELTGSTDNGCEGDFNDKDEGHVNLTAAAYAASDRKININGDTRMGLVSDVNCRRPIDMYERRKQPVDQQRWQQCRRRSVVLEGGQHPEDNRQRRRRSLDTLDSCSAAAVADACRASGRQSEGQGFCGKENSSCGGGRRLEKRGRRDRVDRYGDLLECSDPSISTPRRSKTDQERIGRSCSRCCCCRKQSGCRGTVVAGAGAAGGKHQRCGALLLPAPRIPIPRQRRLLNVAPGKNIVRESPDHFRADGVRRVEERNWGRPKCSMMDINKDKVANSGLSTDIWRGRDGSEMHVPLRKEEEKSAGRRGKDEDGRRRGKIEHVQPLVESNASGSVGEIYSRPPRRPRQRPLEANRHRARRRSEGRESGKTTMDVGGYDGTGDIPTVTRPKPPLMGAAREPVVSTPHPRRLVNVAQAIPRQTAGRVLSLGKGDNYNDSIGLPAHQTRFLSAGRTQQQQQLPRWDDAQEMQENSSRAAKRVGFYSYADGNIYSADASVQW